MSTSQGDSETLAEPLVLRGVAAVSPAGRKAYPGDPRAADHGREKHSTWRKLCSTRKREKVQTGIPVKEVECNRRQERAEPLDKRSQKRRENNEIESGGPEGFTSMWPDTQGNTAKDTKDSAVRIKTHSKSKYIGLRHDCE